MPKSKSAEAILEPQGTIDITQARQLRDDLLSALAENSQLTVKLAGVIEADMTFFQLLCAAHREAAQAGKSLSVDSEGIQEPLQRLVIEGGIARQFDCQHVHGQRCLWCGEGWQ
jgi:anti-anti-sigma regulatory factor